MGYNIKPGSADAISWAKAVGKMIAMGAQTDPALLKKGAQAHHAAIQGLPACGVLPEAKLTEINAAIGRMIASVPKSTTMDVYNSVGALVDPKVPEYLMSTVKEQDAKAAYQALVEFTNVVKANPIASSSVSAPSKPAIDSAAAKLSAAAYPLIKDVDWTSDLFSKPIPGQSAQDVLKAVDKMIVMGAAMDGGALRGCAVAGRLRGHQRRAREGYLLCADRHGHGRLQLNGQGHWQLPRAEQAVLHRESPGCPGSLQCPAGV